MTIETALNSQMISFFFILLIDMKVGKTYLNSSLIDE